MYQKTYQDQIDREHKKAAAHDHKEKENKNENSQFEEHEIVIRNNEGKICNKRKVVKPK